MPFVRHSRYFELESLYRGGDSREEVGTAKVADRTGRDRKREKERERESMIVSERELLA